MESQKATILDVNTLQMIEDTIHWTARVQALVYSIFNSYQDFCNRNTMIDIGTIIYNASGGTKVNISLKKGIKSQGDTMVPQMLKWSMLTREVEFKESGSKPVIQSKLQVTENMQVL